MCQGMPQRNGLVVKQMKDVSLTRKLVDWMEMDVPALNCIEPFAEKC